jgi:hypothetical protein
MGVRMASMITASVMGSLHFATAKFGFLLCLFLNDFDCIAKQKAASYIAALV